MSLKAKRFGLSCAITTPMQADGTVDLARLAHHAKHVLAGGCDSVTLFGTTGEGAGLTMRDRALMMGAVLGAGLNPDKQLLAGIAATALDDAVEQARMAIEARCRGLLVLPPYYFKGFDDDGLFAWYAQFIEKLQGQARGIILYHIPSQAGVSISVDLVGRLKRAFPGVITGVKDSSGDWATTEAFLKHHGDLAILVGDERHLARAVREGGEGSICGVSNLVPGWLRPVVYEGKDNAQMNVLVNEICKWPVMAAIKALTGHIHGDAGFGLMRAPLRALTDAEKRSLFTAYDAITKAHAV
ncbi:MAG: dihydrodipicolinate synthase family protein [Beijerinckiaceae bacterium]